MGIIAHLVAKDVRRKARSPLGLIAALAFPLLFAGLIALAFGRGDSIPKVRILVDNEDDGLVASLVASAFTSQQASAYFDAKTVTADEGRKLIDDGKASALLIIPKGFTADVLDKKPVKLSSCAIPPKGSCRRSPSRRRGDRGRARRGTAGLRQADRRAEAAPRRRR
jgi:ABC-type Na+ efflux pump permease subunit